MNALTMIFKIVSQRLHIMPLHSPKHTHPDTTVKQILLIIYVFYFFNIQLLLFYPWYTRFTNRLQQAVMHATNSFKWWRYLCRWLPLTIVFTQALAQQRHLFICFTLKKQKKGKLLWTYKTIGKKSSEMSKFHFKCLQLALTLRARRVWNQNILQ